MSNVMEDALVGNQTPLQKLGLLLQKEAEGSKNKKVADLAEAFPLLMQYLANKVPQKKVLEKFNAAYRHTLHPPQFRKMLEAERKRRNAVGDMVACAHCGQALPAIEPAVEPAIDPDVDEA